MKQQLAVQWLIDEIRKLSHNENHHLGMGDIRISQGMLDELEEQAKEMEKQEKIEFACKVYNENYLKDKSFRKIAEELIKSE